VAVSSWRAPCAGSGGDGGGAAPAQRSGPEESRAPSSLSITCPRYGRQPHRPRSWRRGPRPARVARKSARPGCSTRAPAPASAGADAEPSAAHAPAAQFRPAPKGRGRGFRLRWRRPSRTSFTRAPSRRRPPSCADTRTCTRSRRSFGRGTTSWPW
jgi:hypothetical protein